MQSRNRSLKLETLWHKIAAFFRHLTSFLTPKQWLALFLLLNVSAAYAAQASRPVNLNNRDEETTTRLRRTAIRGTCTKLTMEILNKAPITYGAMNGQSFPQSCLVGHMVCDDNGCQRRLSDKCLAEEVIARNFRSKEESISQLRNTLDAILIPWRKDLKTRSIALGVTLSENSATLFFNLINRIIERKETAVICAVAKKRNQGNCEEHARCAEESLIARDNADNLQLQVVRLHALNSVTGMSHSFLVVLNEPLQFSDTRIIKGKDKVKAALKQLKGTICDTWNYEAGTELTTMQENKNGLYGEGAQYDEIRLVPITMNFNDVPFPDNNAAKEFICAELDKLRLAEGTGSNKCLK